MISEALYTLFRVVQYDRSILYQMSTDKAFENNTGSATWLSLTKNIQNPYKPKTFNRWGNYRYFKNRSIKSTKILTKPLATLQEVFCLSN
jgi:hypothetical protein